MRKEKILEILEIAKDGNGDVPMRLVRTAFDKLPEPCEDTISRQAAIDAIDEERKQRHLFNTAEDGLLEARRIINTLTSVQPERTEKRTETHACDLISRKATIDAVNNAFDRETLLAVFVRSIAVRAIRDMPSVQPERKKGEWIEISSINHTYKCSECGRLLVNITDGRNNVSKHYPYCHCGADMKGELNEVRTP